jgi:hypothetical protein
MMMMMMMMMTQSGRTVVDTRQLVLPEEVRHLPRAQHVVDLPPTWRHAFSTIRCLSGSVISSRQRQLQS